MNDSGGGLIGLIFMVVWLAVMIAVIAGAWNIIVMLEIVGRPLWFIVLFIIPLVNFVVAILVSIDLAKSFGKDVLFGIGLFLLGFIFVPILGFGDAQYQGPAAA